MRHKAVHRREDFLTCLPLLVFAIQSIVAIPSAQPFAQWKRQAAASNTTIGTRVDRGYEIYEGVSDSSTGINSFKGIRFAAPPTGALRWQAPQSPKSNRLSVLSAAELGPSCPQASANTPQAQVADPSGNEDCLFLSVYVPQNATNLPVFVWIHGGGYGIGSGSQDLSGIINANNNSFIGVAIQYRLGAFGFLAGDEVHRNDVVNAGILDQLFALQWVQAYIELFGGDPSRVTIAGQSAGAGSVMLLDIAYGGTLGTSSFVNSITASPWAYGNSSQTIFECLVSQSTETLQNASTLVSPLGTFGTWAFLPFTDDVFIQSTPSQALLERKVNGLNQLSGNNAEQGDAFTTQNITTENDLDYIAKLLYYYPSSNVSVSSDGLTRTATGQQQRAQAIYGDSTFVCPSCWLAEAYNANGRTRYKYQYSIPITLHGADLAAYYGPAGDTVGPDLMFAFQRIWCNFITTGNPSISSDIAVGASANGTSEPELENWPFYALWDPKMVNLNQTGGSPVSLDLSKLVGLDQNVTVYEGSGFRNDISLVDGYEWEGGRGMRCDFWLSVSKIVPE
ncbi:carboxylesterase type B [Bimuria novae-zelandiae CBS 107.79]|uniref:Carboxylic ester hydrolase n=1 Tax=Bimuria novae-zelandiae CBS 107.79 TaxID=1447943 RepID=A0A6A5UWA4_9PLEO|nr:carboxylesterase type B [Bimuria novae-zelandiae CBS 107.79]